MSDHSEVDSECPCPCPTPSSEIDSDIPQNMMNSLYVSNNSLDSETNSDKETEVVTDVSSDEEQEDEEQEEGEKETDIKSEEEEEEQEDEEQEEENSGDDEDPLGNTKRYIVTEKGQPLVIIVNTREEHEQPFIINCMLLLVAGLWIFNAACKLCTMMNHDDCLIYMSR